MMTSTDAIAALANFDFTELTVAKLDGEERNCLAQHNADSCLFPIRGAGVHHDVRGSTRATVLLHRQLDENPADLTARWLLNLAYMTRGLYPDGVPEPWLYARPRRFFHKRRPKELRPGHREPS